MPLPSNYGNLKSAEQPDFKVMPDDVYQVKIMDIKLLENQPQYKNPQVMEDQLKFEFLVTEEGEFKGTKLFSKNIRPVMNAAFAGGSPSTLYKIFCAVNNITLDPEAAKTVTAANINDMIGKEVRVRVKPTQSKATGKTYNNVDDYLPLKSYKVNPNPLTSGGSPPTELPDPEDIPF